MKHSTTELPAGYREILTVNLQTDKKTAKLINGAACVLMIVMGVGMHFVVPVGTLFDMEAGMGPYFLRLFALLAGYFVYVVLHELTHAAVMKHYGAKKVRFGFTGLYAYAGSEEDYFDKRAYRRIALAPLVVWGVIFLILQFLVPTSWCWVVWFWQIGNVAGAAGDVYVTLKFAPMPADILVKDTGVDMTVWSRENG